MEGTIATNSIGRAADLYSRSGACLVVIIIGAGFGGIGMAHSLKARGIDNLIIVEKADTGGVWRDNVYPGAACDVPSHLYSFSFAPNSNWSRMFAVQSEIHAYLERSAEDLGIREYWLFGTKVRSATFDEAVEGWTVQLSDGRVLTARLLMRAVGQLSRPAIPRLAGSKDLQIPTFLSTTWDHSIPLEGMRIGVIGTGASTIQFVPAIADWVSHMTVFQRSSAYILQKPDRPYTAGERQRFAAILLSMRLHRLQIYMRYEARARASSDAENGQVILAPQGLVEQVTAAALRGFLHVSFRTLTGLPFPAGVQRGVVALLATLMPGIAGITQRRADIGASRIDLLTPRHADGATARGAILYLHGGAFCLALRAGSGPQASCSSPPSPIPRLPGPRPRRMIR